MWRPKPYREKRYAEIPFAWKLGILVYGNRLSGSTWRSWIPAFDFDRNGKHHLFYLVHEKPPWWENLDAKR